MAPTQYSVALQKGIVGGFAPPTPSALYSVSRENDSTNLSIQRQKREAGQPSLCPLAPKTVPAADAEHLIDELHGILKQIPTEQPPGSEDIYGLDTGIFWQSDDMEWINGGPAGCGGGTSTVKPTDEQKNKFKRAVEIVEELAK